MAHSYQVDSVNIGPDGDLATLMGSVDGIAVTVQFWWSAASPLGILARRVFVARLMLAAAYPPQGTSDNSLLGGFLQ